jgi:hypothetical protein
MHWVERLYERPIKRPLDDQLREAINAVAARRRHELPIAADFAWHATDPVFTIRSNMLSFIVSFAPERFTVDAKMSLAAKMLATESNRKQAIGFFDSIADELDL